MWNVNLGHNWLAEFKMFTLRSWVKLLTTLDRTKWRNNEIQCNNESLISAFCEFGTETSFPSVQQPSMVQTAPYNSAHFRAHSNVTIFKSILSGLLHESVVERDKQSWRVCRQTQFWRWSPSWCLPLYVAADLLPVTGSYLIQSFFFFDSYPQSTPPGRCNSGWSTTLTRLISISRESAATRLRCAFHRATCTSLSAYAP